MALIGFSTGALAHGDFRSALGRLSRTNVKAVELSALRDNELRPLMEALPDLNLSKIDYVSLHVPSKFVHLSESDAADMLQPCIDRGISLVLHPDAISDVGCWRRFGGLLCIENMDKRKPTGRTADELSYFFNKLPEARLCLDLAHAAQVDGTMSVAREILCRHGARVAQLS